MTSVQNIICLAEAKRSNILITGSNSTGKSLTAMLISDTLIKHNWQVLCFDNTGIWKDKSSIRTYFQVSPISMKYVLPKRESMIYDISLLLPSFQKEFVENVLNDVWNLRVTERPEHWLLIVTEESHLYMRNIRGSVSQNLMRICSVGRNHKIRTLAISPSLTGIDKEFVRLSSQRYHFKISPEQHTLRRFRSYYGNDWTREARLLETGWCLYYLNEKIRVRKIPLFRARRLSMPYRQPEPQQEPSLWQKIRVALSGHEETEDDELEEEEDFLLILEDEEDEEL